MSEQQSAESDGIRAAAQALLDYFNNGGPDTPIRTTWRQDGRYITFECWEVLADDMRPLLEALSAALSTSPGDPA